MSKKLSLAKIRLDRNTSKLVPRSYKMHPIVAKELEKRALEEGTSKISLLEKMIVEYLNKRRIDVN